MPPPKLYTLVSLLSDPTPVLAMVRRKFPRVNWKQETLDTPEIAGCLQETRKEIAGDPKLLALPVEDLKDHVEHCYHMFYSAMPGNNSVPHQIAYAHAVAVAIIVLSNLPLHVQKTILGKMLNEHIKGFWKLMERSTTKYPSLDRVFLSISAGVFPKKMFENNRRRSRTRKSRKSQVRSVQVPINAQGTIIN